MGLNVTCGVPLNFVRCTVGGGITTEWSVPTNIASLRLLLEVKELEPGGYFCAVEATHVGPVMVP